MSNNNIPMASIKVKFRPSSVADGEGTVYYQVIHERKVRQLSTSYHVFPSEWDEKRGMVTTSRKSERKSIVLSIRERIRGDVERLTKVIRRLDLDGYSYTADDVVDEFVSYLHEYSLFNYMENVIVRLKQNGKIRTAETHRATLNSFRKFRQGEDLMLDCLDSKIMEAYEAWQRKRGVTPNTISFYARILRAVYNRAVEDGVIENRMPFRRIYTGIDKTVKRALPLAVVRQIKDLDLSHAPALDFARDMFMMSFYLRGMSFIDMAYLKKSDLRNGRISYRRHKTGQQLTIQWTDDMQCIMNKYPKNESAYLLPVIKSVGINERYAYLNVGYNINRSLKQISGLLQLRIHLTMYVARHSWASIAQTEGIPLSVISEGMGHNSETTTRIYLASLDTSVVDQANAAILERLNQ